MKKSLYIIIAVIILALAVVAFLRFIVGGDEDTWICSNGQWVKHGNPSVAKPTTGCRSETNNINNTNPSYIDKDFNTKIVYARDQDIAVLQADCRGRNGYFSTCGSPCGPDEEKCITECAITCDRIPPPNAPACETLTDRSACEARGDCLAVHDCPCITDQLKGQQCGYVSSMVCDCYGVGGSNYVRCETLACNNNINTETDERCQNPQLVPCKEASNSGFIYDSSSNKCTSVIGISGCIKAQFQTQEECEATCFLSMIDNKQNQFNWSTMSEGPYRDKITFATSSDLMNWTPSGKTLAQHASVPGAVVKDNTIFVYFVDVSRDGVQEQLGMVKSEDYGKTWTDPAVLIIDGLDAKATADPAPVLLSDGRIRLYYFDINEARASRSAAAPEPTNKIYSAISSDGVNFTQEASVRFERQGAFDPDVELVNGTWYMYTGDVEGNKVIVATSTDGLTFTEKGIAYTGGAVPDVWHENDEWYLFTAGIDMATSTDGLSFTSAGRRFVDRDRGGVTADPSVVKLSSGNYLMMYKVK